MGFLKIEMGITSISFLTWPSEPSDESSSTLELDLNESEELELYPLELEAASPSSELELPTLEYLDEESDCAISSTFQMSEDLLLELDWEC